MVALIHGTDSFYFILTVKTTQVFAESTDLVEYLPMPVKPVKACNFIHSHKQQGNVI